MGKPQVDEGRITHLLLRSVDHIASLSDRAVTWGLDPDERDRIIAERADDRLEHLRDPDSRTFGSFASRVARSIVSDVLDRFRGEEPTALPASVGFLLLGVGLTGPALLVDMAVLERIANVVAAAGALSLARSLARSPRKIDDRSVAAASGLLSLGCVLGALTLPVSEATPLVAIVTLVGIIVGAGGFGITTVGLLRNGAGDPLTSRGGAAVWSGFLLFGLGHVGWAMHISARQPAYALLAIGIAGGSVAVLNAIGRLRFLPSGTMQQRRDAW